MSSSAPELIEEPRTWREFIIDIAKQHTSALYLGGFVFFFLFAVAGVSIIAHVHLTEVPSVAAAEAERGVDFSEHLSMFGVYLNTILYVLAGGACLYTWISVR